MDVLIACIITSHDVLVAEYALCIELEKYDDSHFLPHAAHRS